MRDAVDGISEYAPQLLVDHDLDPFSYTGNARFSQGFFDLAAALGHPVTMMVQETYSGRSREGYQAGVYDCRFAEARARERGWHGPIAYVVSDGNGADRWDCSDYAHGISDAATVDFRIVGYGANGVLDSFEPGARLGAGAGLLVLGTDGRFGRWVPETWGGTNLIGQVVGPSPIPNTDLNHVHADYAGGAPPATEEDDPTMYLIAGPVQAGRMAVLVEPGGHRVQEWIGGPTDKFGMPLAALAEAPSGHKRIDFGSVEPADGAWYNLLKLLDARDAAPAAGQGGATVLDPAQFARDVAGHLTVSVGTK